MDERKTDYREMAADIVAAYVRHNTLSPANLLKMLADTHNQLVAIANSSAEKPVAAPPIPAVPINRSIRTGEIVCLDCGKAFKALKRHLASEHGLSVDDYRLRWKLPPEYPVTAPDYTAARSALAKRIGLGKKKPTGSAG